MSRKIGQVTYKEIHEQALAFQGVRNNWSRILSTFDAVFSEVQPEEVIFTGCGTSLYLAQASAAVFSYYNELTASAVSCSELIFSPGTYIKSKKVLVVPITRSSDATEVRMAIQKVNMNNISFKR